MKSIALCAIFSHARIEESQFCRKNRIRDGDLCEVAKAMSMGSIDADLGGGVFKQRLRREGRGKPGGFRTIVRLRRNDRLMFAYGFRRTIGTTSNAMS